MNINIESKAAQTRKAGKAGAADYRRSKSGHAFSAANPYGKKAAGDTRQFIRD